MVISLYPESFDAPAALLPCTINIVRSSSSRVLPFCSVFDRCGGYSLQHMDYKAQLEFKTNPVKKTIKRI